MLHPKTAAVVIALAVGSSNAFSPLSSSIRSNTLIGQQRVIPSASSATQLRMVDTTKQEDQDAEIERLKSMAAALRAEAAQLESDRQEELTQAVEKAFSKFDTNQDGKIDLAELKAGLEKELKSEVSDSRVKKIMDDFDTSGDGALQLDEFVTVDQFRNRLEQLIRDEKQLERQLADAAKKEKEAAKRMEEAREMINDRDPTASEKVIATLPYLFPFVDSLQFGKYIMLDNADNPVVAIIAIIYTIYRSIPFSGLISFFALNILSGNPKINSLIRFNMQQAIFLDIALFFPGLLGALVTLLLSGVVQIPQAVNILSSDAIFAVACLACLYGAGSSLLGIKPNKIPLLSEAVEKRMPRFEVMDMEDFNKMMEENKDKDKKD